MPPEHLAVTKGWDPERLRNWAADIGPHTAAVIQHLLGARKHPQQAYRTCLGVLRMGKDYGRDRLEAACRRAIDLKAPNYKFIDSTLKNGLDREPRNGSGPGRPAACARQRARAFVLSLKLKGSSYASPSDHR